MSSVSVASMMAPHRRGNVKERTRLMSRMVEALETATMTSGLAISEAGIDFPIVCALRVIPGGCDPSDCESDCEKHLA